MMLLGRKQKENQIPKFRWKVRFLCSQNERFTVLVAKVCVCKVWVWVLTGILGSSVRETKQLKRI